MPFCLSCNRREDHATSCPQCGRGYLSCEGCTFCGYNLDGQTMLLSNRLKLTVEPMPQNMKLYEFPCGETSCDKTATMQFTLATLDGQYQMPLCSIHAARLAKDASTSRL